MDKQKSIDVYLEGWRVGDPSLSYGATASDFTYDDPNTGIIPRDSFVGFFNDFMQAAADMKDEPVSDPFLHYRDVIMDKSNPTWTVWCWWHAAGTTLQGCALIKVGDAGVLSEQIAYYTRLPAEA